jgi:hypothetical protein
MAETTATTTETTAPDIRAEVVAHLEQAAGKEDATTETQTTETVPPVVTDEKQARRDRAAAQLTRKAQQIKQREQRFAAKQAGFGSVKEFVDAVKKDPSAAFQKQGIDYVNDIIDPMLGKKKEEVVLTPGEKKIKEELDQYKADLAREKEEGARAQHEAKQAKFEVQKVEQKNVARELCFNEAAELVTVGFNKDKVSNEWPMGEPINETVNGPTRWPNVIYEGMFGDAVQCQIDWRLETGETLPLGMALDFVQKYLEDTNGRVETVVTSKKKPTGIRPTPGTGPGQVGRNVAQKKVDSELTHEELREAMTNEYRNRK